MQIAEKIIHDAKISTYFNFVFEKGEHRGESYDVDMQEPCKNPLCTCSDMIFTIRDPGEREKIAYRFSLEIEKKNISNPKQYPLPVIDANFAKAFMSELTSDDWQALDSLHRSLKGRLSDNPANVEALEVDFSNLVLEIEQQSAMVTYHEFFPYANPLIFTFEGKEYNVDEQYCIASHCNCRSVLLCIYPLFSEDNTSEPVKLKCFFHYDYAKETFKDETEGKDGKPVDKEFDAALLAAFKAQFPAYRTLLKTRHRTLRTLYASFREKQNAKMQQAMLVGNVGRNDPCPCGSGKKYKKCCMGKA